MLPVGTCASELAGVVERRAYRMRGQTLQQQRGGFRADGRFGRHRHEGRDRLLPSAVLLDGVLLSPMPETGVAVEGLVASPKCVNRRARQGHGVGSLKS